MNLAVGRARRLAMLFILGLSAILTVAAPVSSAYARGPRATASATRRATKQTKRHTVVSLTKRHTSRSTRHRAPAPTLTPVPVSPPTPTSGSTPNPAGMPGAWSLALDSTFNRSSLNSAIWQTGWFGTGTTSPVNPLEQDCYSPSNVTFPGDGTLHLGVTTTPSTCGGVTHPYTGALVSTNPSDGRATGGFQYTYGALEARVYLPASGTQVANWPAIWTDGQPPWPVSGENDIMEGLAGKTCFHFHSILGGPGTCVAGSGAGWHTFASDWEPGSVTYYYDGVQVGRITTGITGSPMYIVLDNTVSANDSTPAKAADMQVAYVRVWQH